MWITLSRIELVQTETLYTPEPLSITYCTTYTRFPIVEPDDDDLPPKNVPVWENMVHIQTNQNKSYHHNRNQILYLMNISPHLQSFHPFVHD